MNTIYGIRAVCDEVVIYIGYSTNFNQRKLNHKSNCLNPKSKKHHFPIYKHIRENGGFDKYEFVVLDKSNDNIRFKEREYTDKYGLNNLLNVYGGDTGLSKSEYNKNYNKKHKMEINEKQRATYQKNKERENERSTAYRLANKEQINEKFNCCCGGRYTKGHRANHFGTDKHISYINNPQN